MLKLYYAASVDCSIDYGEYLFNKIIKPVLDKYPKIEVFGAGIGESPIINLNSSFILKKAIVAYDLRMIRQCDILLVVTDLVTFCAGTFMELEYARQLGLFTILLCLAKDKVKNIFLETLTDKVIYSLEELEEILKELSK